jgi:hypothetical protein
MPVRQIDLPVARPGSGHSGWHGMAPQPLEMAQLTVALYANVAARADVAERWEMMQRLLPPGIAVVKVDPSECASDAEAVEKLAAADAIVCLPYGGVVVDDALASQLPKLRHVQLLSAGFSEVTPQIAEMQQRGITVSNSACAPCLLATTAASSRPRATS